MKVVVDMSLCDLHGLCVETAPEVFQIGDDGALHVLIEVPPEDLRAKLSAAVRECRSISAPDASRWPMARVPTTTA